MSSLPPDELKAARNRFVDSMSSAQSDFADNQEFLAYWRSVESASEQSEDLGQLDRWVKDLARDKDRVEALIHSKQTQASSDQSAAQLIMILQRILAVLDDLYERIRKRHHELHDRVAWWLLLAPGGKKSKPLPQTKDELNKDKKKEATVTAQNLAAKKQKKTPAKKKT